jgi:hypothetical protein
VQYEACKYPVSGTEVASWLAKCGFEILEKSGDRTGGPYEAGRSSRALFWARKP